jgi:hypothetical protein
MSSPVMSGAISSPPPRKSLVPASKAKEVANFAALSNIAREYRLGHEALSDLAYKGENLIRKVKPFILRATDESGYFYKTWKALSARRSAKMVKSVNKAVPWLKRFEDDWATEWLLKKLIDQRVHDRNRASAKKKTNNRKSEILVQLGGGKMVCWITHDGVLSANAI